MSPRRPGTGPELPRYLEELVRSVLPSREQIARDQLAIVQVTDRPLFEAYVRQIVVLVGRRARSQWTAYATEHGVAVPPDPALSVACPVCRAAAGAPCTKKPAGDFHAVRWRLAARQIPLQGVA